MVSCSRPQGSVTSDSNYLGGFAGYVSSCLVDDCDVETTLRSTNNNYTYAGGLGSEAYSSSFLHCDVRATMSIDSNNAEYVGGVVGWTNSCTFTNCTGETQLTVRSGSGWSLGGFVGVSFTSSFVDCDLKTIVVATDFYCVGGSAGYLDYSSFADCDVSDASLSVSNCALTGGFAGQAEETNIASCTFDGQLIIVPGTDYPTGYVAGFVVYASAEIQNQYISNCTVHSGSSITLTDTPTQMHYVGGLIGYGRGSTITGSYS